MGEYNDKQLLEMFQNPETRNLAFNYIINQNQERAYWHIRKIVLSHEDANDITQNTFIKVWKNLEKFKGDSKIYTWIYTIATNESINFLNKKKKHYFESLDVVSYLLSENFSADSYFDGDDIERKLQKALLTLPTKQRIAFNMRYFDNMKYDEISGILGTSVGALKANYHHAKNKIEEFLKEN
ncbi:MAG TPA: sigma-70 family RNA polymerase sigma factor [Flavobacteriales bacterium]|jgi:RNA polymerase sigma factor (sigma-70 family)|nr:sigma-70 family RNA polymerase sigma factor [Flavobacteriales bacterium]